MPVEPLELFPETQVYSSPPAIAPNQPEMGTAPVDPYLDNSYAYGPGGTFPQDSLVFDWQHLPQGDSQFVSDQDLMGGLLRGMPNVKNDYSQIVPIYGEGMPNPPLPSMPEQYATQPTGFNQAAFLVLLSLCEICFTLVCAFYCFLLALQEASQHGFPAENFGGLWGHPDHLDTMPMASQFVEDTLSFYKTVADTRIDFIICILIHTWLSAIAICPESPR